MAANRAAVPRAPDRWRIHPLSVADRSAHGHTHRGGGLRSYTCSATPARSIARPPNQAPSNPLRKRFNVSLLHQFIHSFIRSGSHVLIYRSLSPIGSRTLPHLHTIAQADTARQPWFALPFLLLLSTSFLGTRNGKRKP
eukprot:GHVU01206063.1.p1 GENE.GHVU01206063.1~~GHVU01206063.1.p1  ORF type:complete len:139 (-),score=0.02 GHVU01206063.1:188-604(-)